MSGFKERTTEPEIMDDADLHHELLNAVLRDVSVANRLLGGNRITENAVAQILKEHPAQLHRILDVGCGEGAMLRKLAQLCRRHGYKAEFLGLDLSESSISLARKNSKAYPEIEYVAGDLLEANPQQIQCDIALCTLTLHHIPTAKVPAFLEHMAKTARLAVLVNDLQRSRLAYYLFKAFSVIFIKTKVARHDGLVSIKKGFRRKELVQFSNQIPGYEYMISWKWAFRYLLTLRAINTKSNA
ncbi:MAG: methyltransferase domain-containing protein [Eudoraea sp.]|nr:methyltransferase domain-containing protein [Eudoraea sp.]NNK30566.1 methyltransferase domain-containing protein [Flavobacteriaceae bacterium]